MESVRLQDELPDAPGSASPTRRGSSSRRRPSCSGRTRRRWSWRWRCGRASRRARRSRTCTATSRAAPTSSTRPWSACSTPDRWPRSAEAQSGQTRLDALRGSSAGAGAPSSRASSISRRAATSAAAWRGTGSWRSRGRRRSRSPPRGPRSRDRVLTSLVFWPDLPEHVDEADAEAVGADPEAAAGAARARPPAARQLLVGPQGVLERAHVGEDEAEHSPRSTLCFVPQAPHLMWSPWA